MRVFSTDHKVVDLHYGARYVTLPHESHGYAARESNMHVVAETVAWLDKYVKNATPLASGSRD